MLVGTPAQLRHIAKPREGFEAQLEVLLALYRANPAELYMKSSADEIEAALIAYRSMVAAEESAREQLAAMQEARLVHGSQLWGATLELYARARVVSRTETTMKRGIAGVEQFMRSRRKPQSAPVTSPVATTVPAPASAPVGV